LRSRRGGPSLRYDADPSDWPPRIGPFVDELPPNHSWCPMSRPPLPRPAPGANRPGGRSKHRGSSASRRCKHLIALDPIHEVDEGRGGHTPDQPPSTSGSTRRLMPRSRQPGSVASAAIGSPGHPIRVRAAGAAASDWLDDSLHHLSSDGDPEPAALTVLAWDARAGGAFPVEPSTWGQGGVQRRPWLPSSSIGGGRGGTRRWRRVSGLVDRTTAAVLDVGP